MPEPEPWPEPVNGAELLGELSAAIRRHVVMPDWAADTAALWAVHTYLVDCFGISPRLSDHVTGKGLRQDDIVRCALSHLCLGRCRPRTRRLPQSFASWKCTGPTLLIDEADTFLSENEELRGILNSGHRQGGSVIRTVGEDFEPRSFSTYSACAIALIGKLPATFADRSVPIELRRRRPMNRSNPSALTAPNILISLPAKLARWATDRADRVRGTDPDMPDGIFNRAADNWRPLLAIADAAGGDWPARARLAVQYTGAAGGR